MMTNKLWSDNRSIFCLLYILSYYVYRRDGGSWRICFFLFHHTPWIWEGTAFSGISYHWVACGTAYCSPWKIYYSTCKRQSQLQWKWMTAFTLRTSILQYSFYSGVNISPLFSPVNYRRRLLFCATLTVSTVGCLNVSLRGILRRTLTPQFRCFFLSCTVLKLLVGTSKSNSLLWQ